MNNGELPGQVAVRVPMQFRKQMMFDGVLRNRYLEQTWRCKARCIEPLLDMGSPIAYPSPGWLKHL